jgi:hypothetical protein
MRAEIRSGQAGLVNDIWISIAARLEEIGYPDSVLEKEYLIHSYKPV